MSELNNWIYYIPSGIALGFMVSICLSIGFLSPELKVDVVEVRSYEKYRKIISHIRAGLWTITAILFLSISVASWVIWSWTIQGIFTLVAMAVTTLFISSYIAKRQFQKLFNDYIVPRIFGSRATATSYAR